MQRNRYNQLIGISFGIAGVLGASACSGSQETLEPQPTTTLAPNMKSTPAAAGVNCTPVAAKSWAPVPSNFKFDVISAKLSVPIENVMAGTYGPAMCQQPIALKAIQNGTAPVISVSGKSESCVVIGVEQDPQTITVTRSIIAICAQPVNGSAL